MKRTVVSCCAWWKWSSAAVLAASAHVRRSAVRVAEPVPKRDELPFGRRSDASHSKARPLTRTDSMQCVVPWELPQHCTAHTWSREPNWTQTELIELETEQKQYCVAERTRLLIWYKSSAAVRLRFGLLSQSRTLCCRCDRAQYEYVGIIGKKLKQSTIDKVKQLVELKQLLEARTRSTPHVWSLNTAIYE